MAKLLDEEQRWDADLVPLASPSAGEPLAPLEPNELHDDALDDFEDSPLRGAHFGSMSGRSRQGVHLEHLRAMLASLWRKSRNKLL